MNNTDQKLVEKIEHVNLKASIYAYRGMFRVYIGCEHRTTKKTLKGARGVVAKIIKANY